MVDVFEERSELEAFLSTHPDSLVLVYEEETERVFRGDPEWGRRVIGNVRTSSRDYVAIGPDLRP